MELLGYHAMHLSLLAIPVDMDPVLKLYEIRSQISHFQGGLLSQLVKIQMLSWCCNTIPQQEPGSQ
jgi:hypothetical protein